MKFLLPLIITLFYSINSFSQYSDCLTSEMNLICDLYDIDGITVTLPAPTGSNPVDPFCNGGTFTNSNWYTFAAQQELAIEIVALASTCDTVNGETGISVSIWEGCPDNGGTCIQGNSGCTSGSSIILDNYLAEGGIYNLVIDGCGGSVCTYEINIIEFNQALPIFDTQPSDLILTCSDPNNDNLISNWLNTYGGATFINPCNLPIIISNDYDGSVPDCNTSEIVFFENQTDESVSANIIINGPEIEFEQSSINIVENSISTDICVTISGSNLDYSTDVVVELLTSSSATNGTDYATLPISQTLQFPAASTSPICFSVDIIDDIIIENSEDIIFEITSIITNSISIPIGPISTTTLSIIDNDDFDNDGIENSVDNCPTNSNPEQGDIDNDGIGNLCDLNNTVTENSEIIGNLYLNKNYSGVIVKSPNGTCWIITVHDNGNIKSIPVDCP